MGGGRRSVQRVWLLVYALSMSSLVVWLVQDGSARDYFCAAMVAALGLAVLAVRTGRRRVYGTGVAIGLATLFVAIFPTDPGFGSGGGWCGSVLDPRQVRTVYDGGGDPDAYFQRCDDRAAIHGMIVIVGAATSGLLVGISMVPLAPRPRDDATPASAMVATRATDGE